jgi:hypothetical protein
METVDVPVAVDGPDAVDAAPPDLPANKAPAAAAPPASTAITTHLSGL